MLSQKPMFSSGNPHFFKIILTETLKENKIQVPQYFVKKCGETLTESVSVKLPCGSKWTMKLENYNGKFWLQKGWPEFMKHYAIKRGYMLTFRYDGNSEIYAVIFDTNTVEIDYPPIPIHFGKSNIDGELRAPKREVIDDSIDNLDDISPCHKTGLKSSCSQPPKRMKTSSTGKFDSPSKSNRDKSATTTTKKMKYGIPKIIKALDQNERLAALQRASGFKSEHPFYKVVMQPYYLVGKKLTFSCMFANTYLNNRCYDVTLKVPIVKKTWPVKYTYREHKRAKPRLLGGWKTFVQDNNLEVGDVLVFVLIKETNVSFEVVIFRAGESSKGSVNTSRIPSFLNSSPEMHQHISKSSQRTEPRLVEKKFPLTFDERVKVLEKDAIEHGKSFFKIVIQPSNKCHVHVPFDIVEKHIRNEGDVVLSIPNSRQYWSAQLRKRKSYITGNSSAVIFNGWKEFMADNNLEVGDVCIFELLNGTEIWLQVLIVRVSDDL
ncbi:B3 domain-containing transcription factor VRN1-like isoform X2 [Humulus lupulus]|uniref:B3 domain-containing transcription factor VRN1-like isoform X2 n=1 Tax=Humulus lupulus TaxID=3486 RepID=UPI002B402059|nr:B3 domain-containing transcription factor VRN1-like isoform X2 [Humulus lupulus]